MPRLDLTLYYAMLPFSSEPSLQLTKALLLYRVALSLEQATLP